MGLFAVLTGIKGFEDGGEVGFAFGVDVCNEYVGQRGVPADAGADDGADADDGGGG